MLCKQFCGKKNLIQHYINTNYANMHIIVITHTSYAISSIKVCNDLSLCTKRQYILSHL